LDIYARRKNGVCGDKNFNSVLMIYFFFTLFSIKGLIHQYHRVFVIFASVFGLIFLIF